MQLVACAAILDTERNGGKLKKYLHFFFQCLIFDYLFLNNKTLFSSGINLKSQSLFEYYLTLSFSTYIYKSYLRFFLIALRFQ